MAFGFVIERFSLFLAAVRQAAATPKPHIFSLLVGVSLIVLGAGIALASSIAYGRFLKTLPRRDVSAGYLIGLGSIVSLAIAAVGIILAVYLLLSGLGG
jgi:putative membrane protein